MKILRYISFIGIALALTLALDYVDSMDIPVWGILTLEVFMLVSWVIVLVREFQCYDKKHK